MDSTDKLTLGSAELGLNLGSEAKARFSKYAELLLSWNQKMNLTAITDTDGIIIKHFLDSLTVFSAFAVPRRASVIDVGTGAGFPGLPMKIAQPELRLTLLDSLAKRTLFLDALSGELGLDVKILHARAEEGGRLPELRDSFDIAVSRAVARLRELCEYCLPYVKPGGVFIAMKGGDIAAELDEAGPAISALNAGLDSVKRLVLPLSDNARTLIVIRKLRHTPADFPRKQAQISKSPIKQPDLWGILV
jgi:16S rRNA (guanine(527)-N(7))-methyltransferase RsmG